MNLSYMEANNGTLGYLPQDGYPISTGNERIRAFERIERDTCSSANECTISLDEVFVGNFVPNMLPDFIKRLNEIRSLPDNWDTQGTAAPNYQAYFNAMEVVEVLSEMDFIPAKLVPSAEEGIGIFFAKENKYGFIECLNDGEIVVALSDRQEHRRVWQIMDTEDEIKGALETLKGFINAA